jgi:hypothetical protein
MALSFLAAFCVSASGCNIFAAGAIIVAGDPKIDQQFKLDPKRATVIFVDDRSSRLPKRSLRQVMAQEAQQILISERALTNAIDARAAFAAASADREGTPLSITGIGKAAQAEVVIWVAVDSFYLSPDGQVYQPAINMRVKVMDAVTDSRIWPEEKEGFKLTAMMRKKANYAPRSQSELAQGEIEAAKWAGTAVAQLFYRHLADQSALTPK